MTRQPDAEQRADDRQEHRLAVSARTKHEHGDVERQAREQRVADDLEHEVDRLLAGQHVLRKASICGQHAFGFHSVGI
jgi:hypothetical protein